MGDDHLNQHLSLEERIADRYTDLSGQLRKAADYTMSHPIDVASRSLRNLSQTANVSPATFSRLARANQEQYTLLPPLRAKMKVQFWP